MSFLEYEKSTNLFVQAMKGTSLGSALRKINHQKWAVLVPQSVSLDELGLGVVSIDFLQTHTVVFNSQGAGADKTFTTLNGLRGAFVTSKGEDYDGSGCDSVVMELPADQPMGSSTPLGPITTNDSPTSQSPHQTKQQTIHILRQTELEIDPTDGFTIPIYLVADAVRAKWITGDPLESIGWFSEKQQEPRKGGKGVNPMQPQAVSSKKDAKDGKEPPVSPANVQTSGGSTPTKQRTGTPPKPRPKFRFRDFAEKMRQARAADLHKTLKTFVTEVQSGSVPSAELPSVVQQFLSRMFAEIKQNPVWKGASDQELDFAQEGLEKYVLTKIFSQTFCTEEDRIRDENLEKRLKSFKFIEPENLEVRAEILDHPIWQSAVQELQKLNEYKNPRDKLICITNSCKLIFSVLHSLEPGKAMGADDFLPCLILLVGKADAKQLHSNTTFIQNYRNESKMSSEAGYYFCTLLSAIHFWETADANSLRISQKELDEINAGLADKPKPDFSDVSIDEGDTWDMEKSVSNPSGAKRAPALSTDDRITPIPSPMASTTPDYSALSSMFGAASGAASAPDAPTDPFEFAGGDPASDEALKAQLTALLTSSPSSQLQLPSPKDYTVADIQLVYEEWQRLSALRTSAAAVVTQTNI